MYSLPICQGAATVSTEISVEKDVDMSKTGSMKTSCCLRNDTHVNCKQIYALVKTDSV